MGRYLVLSSSLSIKPTSRFSLPLSIRANSQPQRVFCTSELPNQKHVRKVGAASTGSVPFDRLLHVVQTAAETGAQVVMDAVNKPRNISYKGLTDLVTDTDKMSEAAVLDVVRKHFRDHLILGEEGGLIGDSSSDYLWCIDPLGEGAFCNGDRIYTSQTDKVEQALLVTGFGYEHDDAWATNIELFKEFTDISRGVRRLGAASVDMCHVALGIVEAYWEYRLKPWDMAAGVLLLERIGPATEKLKIKGIDFSLWYKPENYCTQL
ncbi:hypothetical protein F511_38539 [Dorcoceras hygrometricum]|uniref:Inositol-phosphate phosphatase n=1 Tax=Dorcoceras hygrometricum TaxID=472368 RepID=A0A2Z7C6H5_9LAMI|nr:hypothetical protein F511_38539 [Dorcoceras hygrometricum]